MRVINQRSPRSMVSKMSVIAALGAVCIATPTIASAQISIGGSGGIDLSEALGKALSESISKMMNRKVVMTPAIVNIDATAKTATLEFTNGTEDTLVATVSVGNTAPLAFGVAPNAATQAGGLLADDEPAKAEEAIDAKSSLAPWIKDLPAKITLAPGEKKQVTVKLEVPAGTAEGEYSAWVLAATEPGSNKQSKDGGASIQFQSADGKSSRPKLTTGSKLVYRVVAPK